MYRIMETYAGNVIVLDQNGVRLSFRENPENADYQRYLEWVAEGNTAEEWQPEELV